MIDISQYEVWFVCGSQHLYGEETLKRVDVDARAAAAELAESPLMPVQLRCEPVVTDAKSILSVCRAANADENCVGLIFWMHTFSPAKMWINGLTELKKPFLHFHTQFNKEIPWASIDMDFMNLNQSAHGGREFGYICTRLGMKRKVVVGHRQDERAVAEIAAWTRAAAARQDSAGMKIARFGDNMREVAVTEGDKTDAQIRFGYSVNGYGLGDLTEHLQSVSGAQTDELLDEYEERYILAPEVRKDGAARTSLIEAARIELAMRSFLEDGGFTAFTTTFENLHGLSQLPGLAVQRIMADGYGFGAEGDWKTAALLRSVKVMAAGSGAGTSFMEDYTYHLADEDMLVLGAHMLEVCPSIADGKPLLTVKPLSIGGKADPARLVFTGAPGPAVNATIVDMGDRFRMIVNEVEAVKPRQDLPNLPVARVLWKPKPDLVRSAKAWILAGGAHHTVYSQGITAESLEDFARIVGIEYIFIGDAGNLQAEIQ
jgi:L-arabinose isomerase